MGIIRRRDGSQTVTDETQDRALAFLYRTAPGRSLLKLLVQPWVSALGGAALDHPLSTVLIPGFVRHFQMDLSDYQKETYRSYNAFSPGRSARRHGRWIRIRQRSSAPVTQSSRCIPSPRTAAFPSNRACTGQGIFWAATGLQGGSPEGSA